MKLKILAALAALTMASNAYALTAYFTGRMEQTTSVTGRLMVYCQYSFGGDTFWQTFSGYTCPVSIEVE